MTLAFRLDASAHEGLDAALQSFYVKQDDGNYRLDTDAPDTDGLKAKTDELLGETKRERELRKAAEDRANALEAAQQKALDDNARAQGDVESLSKSYEDKISKINEGSSTEIQKLESQIYSLTVGRMANDISNELAIKGSAPVMLPHIEKYIASERDENGNLKTWFLDENGNKTSEKKEEFMNRFRNNPAFKPLIAANGASGSGANGANGSAGHSNKSASDMSEADRLKLYNENRDLYNKTFPK